MTAEGRIVGAPPVTAAPPQCRVAVERCYSGLCRCGHPGRFALEAAVAVFRFHCPYASEVEAENIVCQWLTPSDALKN